VYPRISQNSFSSATNAGPEYKKILDTKWSG
jgi:hypothetical protein